MLISPILDAIVPAYLQWLSNPWIFALSFLVIVLIEAAILRAMNWGTFLRSLLDAFLMNLTSTLAGFFLINAIAEMGLLGVLWAGVLSVLVEGFFLVLTRLHTTHRALLVALAANLGSYLPLILVLLLFGDLH